MEKFEITWRDLVRPAIVFIIILASFNALHYFAGWPNASNGWPAIVTGAIIVVFLPLIAKAVTFLQRTKANIEGPFGVKLSFAVATSEMTLERYSPDLAKGLVINETSRDELERAASAAREQESIAVDLEDGRAWYETRLFALASDAVFSGSPKLIVIMGTKCQKASQVAGSIAPRDIVRQFIREDSRYEIVEKRTKQYIDQLRIAKSTNGAPPSHKLQNFGVYWPLYDRSGDTIFMRILISQFQRPDPDLKITPIEDDAKPVWLSIAQLEARLQPWLSTDFVDMDAPIKKQIEAILAASGNCAVATRRGSLEGIINVAQAQRRILDQLVQRSIDL